MTEPDGAWLDRMYDNRALVPAHPVHFRDWAARSAEAMRSHPRELDVRYGGGPSEHLDVFAAPQADAPVLVFIHGGYWRAMDKRDHAFIAPAFTAQGACVVVPNYALAPAVSIPQIVMQMVQALAWTWRHIGRYGGNRERIVVAGHSAGGHLAAMLLSCVWPVFGRDLPSDLVKGALSISGLHDLEPFVRTPFLKDSLQLTRAQARRASPALLPPPAQGVLYAVAGGDESEEYHRQLRMVREAWGPERVPVCEQLPGLNHFSVLDALLQPGHRLNTLALGLLAGQGSAGA
ncbi:MAG TPA: alpha/beta hydrolase [Ramlibacter sp.]|nr:alpha/beta hydrolase [Ramlibacter sp.]